MNSKSPEPANPDDSWKRWVLHLKVPIGPVLPGDYQIGNFMNAINEVAMHFEKECRLSKTQIRKAFAFMAEMML